MSHGCLVRVRHRWGGFHLPSFGLLLSLNSRELLRSHRQFLCLQGHSKRGEAVGSKFFEAAIFVFDLVFLVEKSVLKVEYLVVFEGGLKVNFFLVFRKGHIIVLEKLVNFSVLLDDGVET